MIEEAFGVISLLLTGASIVSPTIDYTILRGRRLSSPWLSLVALVCSGAVLAYGGATLVGRQAVSAFGGMMRVGLFEIFLCLVVTLGAVLVVVASLAEVKRWGTSPSFYSLLTLAALGAYYLIAMQDYALLVGTWALVSVISYVLVGLKKDERSVEGAVKYSLMGIAASVLIVYAIAVVFSLTGSTRVGAMAGIAVERSAVLLASIFFIAAFGFKVGVVPFHGWLPDVYGGVHPMLIASLAAIVAVSVGGLMVKILYPLAPAVGEQWPVLVGLLSFFTMTFGNVVALLQKNFQRMMAYSTIAHMGYVLVGITAALSVGRELGLQGVSLHLASYTFAKVGVFVFLAYLLRKGVGRRVEDLRGLSKRCPVLSVAIVVILLNLIGVPPLLGFWSKFYLFTSVISFAPLLALAAIINSGISVGYYVLPIKYMFLPGRGKVEERLREPDAAIVVFASGLTIAAGLLLPAFAQLLVPT